MLETRIRGGKGALEPTLSLLIDVSASV